MKGTINGLSNHFFQLGSLFEKISSFTENKGSQFTIWSVMPLQEQHVQEFSIEGLYISQIAFQMHN